MKSLTQVRLHSASAHGAYMTIETRKCDYDQQTEALRTVAELETYDSSSPLGRAYVQRSTKRTERQELTCGA